MPNQPKLTPKFTRFKLTIIWEEAAPAQVLLQFFNDGKAYEVTLAYVLVKELTPNETRAIPFMDLPPAAQEGLTAFLQGGQCGGTIVKSTLIIK